MQFININGRYVNMAQVQIIELTTIADTTVLYLYTSDHTFRVEQQDEREAVLAWLNRNSINVLKQRDL